MQCMSWRLPSTGSEIQSISPSRVQATCTFIPVVLCFAEYRPGAEAQDQHGSRVPSTMSWDFGSSSSAVGAVPASAFSRSGLIADIARLIVGLGYTERLCYLRLNTISAQVGECDEN